jgi:raffinose/stachyose/melibiose transport system substrate-binding protein
MLWLLLNKKGDFTLSKTVKKLMLSLFTFVLVLSLLAGCGTDEQAADGTVTLELFSNKSESMETLKALIAKFEEQNPDITIELNTPPEAETVLKTRLTKNDMPDLMAIGGNYTYGELARAGVL